MFTVSLFTHKFLGEPDITSEVEKLACEVGQVFKGVLLHKNEAPRVLTILSIGASSELDRLFKIGVGAVEKQREKKELLSEQNKLIAERLEGLEPVY